MIPSETRNTNAAT